MSRTPVLRVALLTGAALALFLPWPAAAPLGIALLFVWLTLRPERSWIFLVLPPLLVATLLPVLGSRQVATEGSIEAQAEEAFSRFLARLDRGAEEAVRTLTPPQATRSGRRLAFDELQDLASRVDAERFGDEGWTWILFDPDGEEFAWAGRGLVHEIPGASLPAGGGRVHVSGFTAATFLRSEPLGSDRRPWRVACGATVPTDNLPGPEPRRRVTWSVLGPDDEPGAAIRLVEAGDLRFGLQETGAPAPRVMTVPFFLAALGLGVATLLLAAGGEPPLRSWWLLPALGLVVLLAQALVLAAATLAVLAAGLVGLWWGSERAPRAPRSLPAVVLAGIGLAAVLVAVASLAQLRLGPVDLGSGFGGGGGRLALRLALFGGTLGALRLLRGSAARSPGGWGPWGPWSAAALIAGAALSGWKAIGLLCLAGGSVGAVGWSARSGWRRGAGVGVVLAALIPALAWEVSYTGALERRLARELTADLGPPSRGEIGKLSAELEEFFRRRPLEELTTAAPEDLDATDLAFALWRRSPLARRGRVSAVAVGPAEEPVSVFDYGLTAASGGGAGAGAGAPPEAPGWWSAALEGRGVLTLGGGPWSSVDYRLVLQPGFRRAVPVGGAFAAGLLQGGRSVVESVPGMPPSAKIGFYAADGEVLLPPWRGAPDLEVDPLPNRVEMPGGWARTFVTETDEGWSVLFLPISTPLHGLERIATHAAVPLLALAVASLLWAFWRLGGSGGWGALRDAWRSFSNRVVIVYTLLLMVPVLLVNLLVLRVFDQRLESEWQASGYSALESAQRILVDYVGSLEFGFGIDTAVGDEVMLWLSRVVHHEVNLYWGNRLSASSKRELFSSGLLSPRIPGDVFARVALSGSDVASRRTRAGDAVYQEFYAPLSPLDDSGSEPALFVSVPLLAQEVATAEEMTTIRRRVVLTALVLAVALALLGRRVGRRLTRPLLQIVDATQSIAAGAPSIQVETHDSEFVTLVEAVDDMAGRIAAGRRALLAEKQLVDEMIDNVNSGVVSIDRDGQVMLMNRTANRLLGAEIGAALADSLAANERLAPVADFVRTSGEHPRQQTVRLQAGGEVEREEQEWSLIWVPLAGSSGPSALFVIEDVTEVLRGQRLEAWAEMARMIAHEVKNPLTPIRLSTEHLREVSRGRREDLQEVLEQCTSNILRQVDELQQIASEFSVYSRIPHIERRSGDLTKLVSEIVASYRHGEVTVQFSSPETQLAASFDERLLGRAIRNLLENAVRATGKGGTVRVAVAGEDDRVEVRVTDDGPGVDPRHLSKLFEPYFSTEASGTGLGLPITRRIVEEHGGEVAARNVEPHGLEVTITLPGPETPRHGDARA